MCIVAVNLLSRATDPNVPGGQITFLVDLSDEGQLDPETIVSPGDFVFNVVNNSPVLSTLNPQSVVLAARAFVQINVDPQ